MYDVLGRDLEITHDLLIKHDLCNNQVNIWIKSS